MIDLQKEDERLINEAYQSFWGNEHGKNLIEVFRELVDKKNKLFEAICRECVDKKIEEIAQEKAKDINGIPVRTLVAKDILTTMIGSGKLKSELDNAYLARISVDMTDELLKALNNK